MSDMFLELLNLSLMASWLILAVLIARVCLKKAPKYIRCILWGLVGLRLIFPFSIESVFSLIPSSRVIEPEILYDRTPTIDSGIHIVDTVANDMMASSFTPNMGDSINPLQVVTFVASNIWVLGIIAMLLYCIISYALVRRKVFDAVKWEDNVYECERIATPFVLGIFQPRIYIPYHMDKEARECVIAHEKAHIKRGDHITKLFGFLVLAVYWFHPLIWVAYILLCRDIELACDERVMKSIGEDQKKNYSGVLLKYSVSSKMVAACPLAFGEVAVKQRIKNVLNYKKPTFWIVFVSVIVCIVVAVCFMTSPKADTDNKVPDNTLVSDGNNIVNESTETDDRLLLMVDDTAFDETAVFVARDDIYSITMVNGSTGEMKETSVLMSDNTMQDLMTLYYALEFEPYEAETEAWEARIGYQYCMRLYDVDGNLLQTITPYKDSVQIDGVQYNCETNQTSVNLLLCLDLIFYPVEATEGIS